MKETTDTMKINTTKKQLHNMTKKQVRSKVNSLIKQSRKQLEADIEKILKEADMWYGRDINPRNRDDRNGDQWVADGILEDERHSINVNDWLITRDELNRM